MNRRVLLAVAIVVAWAGGLGALARRELFKGRGAALAELALRIQPETFYYIVSQGGNPIGYASSSIDTTRRTLIMRDEFAADLDVGGTPHRMTASSRVRTSRAFALSDFDVSVSADSAPLRVAGKAEGDSAVVYTLTSASGPGEPQRLAVKGPILLPTLVPLAVTLGAAPKVGREATVPVFDPTTMQSKDVTMKILAESLFTVSDSAKYDSTAGRWVVAHSDTVRAWRLGLADASQGSAGQMGGWVDERGRLVQSKQAGGLTLTRAAFEVAFENWRTKKTGPAPVTTKRGVLDATAVAAGVKWSAPLADLRVRLRNVALEDFDLDGGRQVLKGDTLSIVRETPANLLSGYERQSDGGAMRVRFKRELSPEPLLQSDNADIRAQAAKIVGAEKDPRKAAALLTSWVHDKMAKEYIVGVPDAAQILKTMRGDCNEHTQLFLALSRAAGVPARAAAGLAYVDGRFFYHAWPEVWLGQWVAVDPTFGQFPADAAHLRFTIGGLARQAMLVRLIGTIGVDVVSATPLR